MSPFEMLLVTFLLEMPQVVKTIFNLQANHIIRFEKPNRDYAPLLTALGRVHYSECTFTIVHIFEINPQILRLMVLHFEIVEQN